MYIEMGDDVEIRKDYHKKLNTFFLFENLLYTEFTHQYGLSSSTYNHDDLYLINTKIDIEFIQNLFEEIWNISNNLEFDSKLAEDFQFDVYNTNEDSDHYKLMREFDLFSFDFALVEKIKDYIINILHQYGNEIKMKHLYKNYIFFIKNEIIDEYRIKLLVSKNNICKN